MCWCCIKSKPTILSLCYLFDQDIRLVIVYQALIFMEIHIYVVPINTTQVTSIFKTALAQSRDLHYLSS